MPGGNTTHPPKVKSPRVVRASGFVRRSGRDRIRKHTDRAFGASLPPHWFRDAAATSIAVEDPKHVADARHVLGHASLATTERFYNQARSLEASRRHQVMLANLCASLKRRSI